MSFIAVPVLSLYVAATMLPSTSSQVKFVLKNDYERMCHEYLEGEGSSLSKDYRQHKISDEMYCKCVFKQVRKTVRKTINSQRASDYVAPRDAIRKKETRKAYTYCAAPSSYWGKSYKK